LRIRSADFVAGAASARGIAIVIDVFRACSVVAHALAAGARCVVPVAGIEDARALKQANPNSLLVGERHARKLPGFDCGNSPSEVLAQDLTGRSLIHTTHAGTQGLTAAFAAAERIFTGAFVNASATVAAVRALAPTEVTVVAMGHEARETCLEDDLCRDWLMAALAGEPLSSAGLPNAGELIVGRPIPDLAERLRVAPAANKFFDPAADWAPEADFALCATFDTVPFAVELVASGAEFARFARPVLRPWQAPAGIRRP
jgi:2-phosphosulfolactate phosphatase